MVFCFWLRSGSSDAGLRRSLHLVKEVTVDRVCPHRGLLAPGLRRYDAFHLKKLPLANLMPREAILQSARIRGFKMAGAAGLESVVQDLHNSLTHWYLGRSAVNAKSQKTRICAHLMQKLVGKW
jgi:hypothetical protein